MQLDGIPAPTTVVGWLVSTGCASTGSVSVVQEPLGFPAAGNIPDGPASLEAPLEAPASLDPLSDLVNPLVAPEVALLPLGPPLPPDPTAFAPLPPDCAAFAPLPPEFAAFAPLPGNVPFTPLSDPDPSDEAPSLWPEVLLGVEVGPPQPMPSETQRENESKVRSAPIVRPRFERSSHTSRARQTTEVGRAEDVSHLTVRVSSYALPRALPVSSSPTGRLR